jgi:hypothetical protein
MIEKPIINPSSASSGKKRMGKVDAFRKRDIYGTYGTCNQVKPDINRTNRTPATLLI